MEGEVYDLYILQLFYKEFGPVASREQIPRFLFQNAEKMIVLEQNTAFLFPNTYIVYTRGSRFDSEFNLFLPLRVYFYLNFFYRIPFASFSFILHLCSNIIMIMMSLSGTVLTILTFLSPELFYLTV